MRATTAGAIMGAAALCLMAGAAEAQTWRAPHSPPPPPVPEAWGTVGSYGQPYRRQPVYDYGQPGRTYDYGDNRSYGYSHGGHGGHGGHGHGGYRAPVRQGYRDTWGYNDDRPHTARNHGSDYRHRDGHYDGCGCPDVYLYDR